MLKEHNKWMEKEVINSGCYTFKLPLVSFIDLRDSSVLSGPGLEFMLIRPSAGTTVLSLFLGLEGPYQS